MKHPRRSLYFAAAAAAALTSACGQPQPTVSSASLDVPQPGTPGEFQETVTSVFQDDSPALPPTLAELAASALGLAERRCAATTGGAAELVTASVRTRPTHVGSVTTYLGSYRCLAAPPRA